MFCKVVFDVPLDRDFDYLIPPELEGQVVPGVRVTAPFGRVLTGGLVIAVSEITSVPSNVTLKSITSVVDKKPLFGSDLFPLARYLKNHWGCPIGQILFALIPPQPYFKLDTPPALAAPKIQRPDFALSAQQQHALDTLTQVPAYQFKPFLLQGPEGTGKTEVILQASEKALSNYGQVLITVPDLVAARQFIAEVENRFGNAHVYCWHSRMLLSKKKAYFSNISNGVPCVVLATRSGVLLPFKNLRFCAMFDEQDENYKQEENKPYYHARDVLVTRAKMHGAVLAYVSATPSAEMSAWAQAGKVDTLSFTQPVGRSYAPQIKLTEKKSEKSRYFSQILLDQLAENLAKKEPVLLILNRRGYANSYYCLNCGAYAKCKKCGTILTHEKSDDGTERLHCKKCGAVEDMQQTCPHCHNLVFKSRGGGTQKIVTELVKFFPQAKLLRLDSDSLKTKDGQGFEALNALKTGQADIIVGTRLASGALRGSRVSLAAILDAELELDGPDFRASEKFGQLLFELRGHLTRVSNGRLLIQTADQNAYDYAPLLSGNYQAAAENELSLREAFGYPPFTHLIRVTLKTKELDLLQAETARIKQLGTGRALEVLGPVWCAKKTDKLKKQYIVFKTDETRYLDLLAQLDSFEPAKKLTVQISADPYNFY